MTEGQRRVLWAFATLDLLVVVGAVALFAIGLPVFGTLLLGGVAIGVVGLVKLRPTLRRVTNRRKPLRSTWP